MVKKSLTYAELRQELDELLETMQHPDIDVDQALQAYERGVKIVAELEKYLKKAENTITSIKASFDKSQGL